MFRRETIIDIIAEDTSALIRLLREVYDKGVSDGLAAANKVEFSSDPSIMFDLTFDSWNDLDDAIASPVDSVEEFIDRIFTHGV